MKQSLISNGLARPLGIPLNPTQEGEKETGLLARLPLAIFLVAVFIGVLHMAPFWWAQLQTPPGYVFTGTMSTSPDYMQYRVWMRQAPVEGLIVNNKFTTEPNKPSIPVLLYYAVGKAAGWLSAPPEYIFEYAGALFALLFTILLYATVRYFMRSRLQTWIVFGVILFGGGLGAILKGVSNIGFFRNNSLIRFTLLEGLWSWPVFEDYRGNYLVKALFDTHFILLWLVFTAVMMALYFTLRKFSVGRLLLTMALIELLAIFHVHEVVTLVAVLPAIVFLLWRKGMATRSTYVTFLGTFAAVVAGILGFMWLYSSSGLPMSEWRGVNILVSTLLMAYPVAWILIAWGISEYWQKASFNETFLMGWALGCVAVTLAGPFHPYPDRGTLTLQIPLYIIAGAIFFSRIKTFNWKVAAFGLAAVVMLGVTPLWVLNQRWQYSQFTPDVPAEFMSPANLQIVAALDSQATSQDVLITNVSAPPWENDLLWLAPDFPGKLYVGHFFLTVNYDQKRQEVIQFYQSTPQDQAAFLQKHNIRYVYVSAQDNPGRFKQIPGLVLVKEEQIGSLFEYAPQAQN